MVELGGHEFKVEIIGPLDISLKDITIIKSAGVGGIEGKTIGKHKHRENLLAKPGATGDKAITLINEVSQE